MTQPTQATPQLLHRFLGLGVTILAGVFLGMTFLGQAPLLREDPDFAATLAYAMSGIAITTLIVGLLVLKPRVPPRAGGQSEPAYWSDPKNLQPIMTVWFVMEGGAVLSCVAFVLAGHPVAGLVMGVTIVAFWLTGPDKFGN